MYVNFVSLFCTKTSVLQLHLHLLCIQLWLQFFWGVFTVYYFFFVIMSSRTGKLLYQSDSRDYQKIRVSFFDTHGCKPYLQSTIELYFYYFTMGQYVCFFIKRLKEKKSRKETLSLHVYKRIILIRVTRTEKKEGGRVGQVRISPENNYREFP